MPSDSPPTPALETATYAADFRDSGQWLTWMPTDEDNRKIPRAPYAYPNWPDRYVNAQNPAVWTDFATAQDWVEKLSGFALAYVIRDRDEYPDEDLVVVDYDDARDPETSTVHPVVRVHLQAAGSYADISPSGTGVHILCRGQLPDDAATVADALPAHDAFPEASIEVYDSARFVTMSGQHVVGTPDETRPAQDFIDTLAETFTTPQTQTEPSPEVEPPLTHRRASLTSTNDIEDVFRAIETTRPSEIRLDSPVTETRSDGTKSRDPCWTHSDSGTRLAEVDDGWIYRNGLVVLDALQVVALEEGIVTTAGDYPDGRDFWRAVAELRRRGADIPEYDPDDTEVSDRSTPSPSSSAIQSLRSLHRELIVKTRKRDELREEVTALRPALAARIREVRS